MLGEQDDREAPLQLPVSIDQSVSYFTSPRFELQTYCFRVESITACQTDQTSFYDISSVKYRLNAQYIYQLYSSEVSHTENAKSGQRVSNRVFRLKKSLLWIRVVKGPDSSGQSPARTRKYKPEPGQHPKTNLKPKSCPKKP